MIRPLQRRPHFVQFSAINGRLQAPLAAVVTDELYPGNPQRPSNGAVSTTSGLRFVLREKKRHAACTSSGIGHLRLGGPRLPGFSLHGWLPGGLAIFSGIRRCYLRGGAF